MKILYFRKVWLRYTTTRRGSRVIPLYTCQHPTTKEEGMCIFSSICQRSNGIHLTYCINRFYFGSCCKPKPIGASNTVTTISTSITTEVPSTPSTTTESSSTTTEKTTHSLDYTRDGPSPNVIQEISLPVITNKACEDMYRKAGFIWDIPDIFICAGYEDGGKDPGELSLRQWKKNTFLHKCGATLLNEFWAITAAHCVVSLPVKDILIRLGEYDVSREDEPLPFVERRVKIVASHPQFNPRTFDYDLALIRFYEPVTFQRNIIPACVADGNYSYVGKYAIVAGWGRLYEDGPSPNVIQEVSFPVITNKACEDMYRKAGFVEDIPDIFICAGYEDG